VELRKGYSGPSLWGRIAEVREAADAEALFSVVDPRLIAPLPVEEAKAAIRTLVGGGALIAFRIDLDHEQSSGKAR
jgi:hypothetical protein